ncbi:MAG: hypothetical protein IPG86_13570 [Chitinophagaceae bacterium]|nr:hypothetical protein [Chitinophagaceae bacterium]
MPRKFFLGAICMALFSLVQAQTNTTVKKYISLMGGDVDMVYNWGEMVNGYSDKVFTVNCRLTSGYFYIRALANQRADEKIQVIVNNQPIDIIYPNYSGWQWIGDKLPAVKLQQGKNEIRFKGNSAAVPMVEDLFMTMVIRGAIGQQRRGGCLQMVTDSWSRRGNSGQLPDLHLFQKMKLQQIQFCRIQPAVTIIMWIPVSVILIFPGSILQQVIINSIPAAVQLTGC